MFYKYSFECFLFLTGFCTDVRESGFVGAQFGMWFICVPYDSMFTQRHKQVIYTS